MSDRTLTITSASFSQQQIIVKIDDRGYIWAVMASEMPNGTLHAISCNCPASIGLGGVCDHMRLVNALPSPDEEADPDTDSMSDEDMEEELDAWKRHMEAAINNVQFDLAVVLASMKEGF